MDTENSIESNRQRQAIELTIRIGLLFLLVGWCFWIIMPFTGVIFWGMIIAVAIYPMHRWFESVIGNRRKLAAGITTLALLILLIAPAAALADSLIAGAEFLYDQMTKERIKLPAFPESIGNWPLIGDSLEQIWRQASTNVSKVLQQLVPYFTEVASVFLSAVAGVGLGLLQFLLATVIAGVLLANAESGQVAASRFAKRIAGTRGEELVRVTTATIRSVARGILGVAFIQAILAGLGFLAVGLPAAGLLALLCMFLGIVQLGIAPVTLPAALYVLYTADTLPAVVFVVWCLIITLLDNFLKPLLLGRGSPVPTVVIFLGAIGGFLAQGILGLFLGAVILSLGYNLYLVWASDSSGEEA